MLNLVDQDLNKNVKIENGEGKGENGVKVIIPLNNDEILKANLSQENKIVENKKNKTEKENKNAAANNNENKSNSFFLIHIFNF